MEIIRSVEDTPPPESRLGLLMKSENVHLLTKCLKNPEENRSCILKIYDIIKSKTVVMVILFHLQKLIWPIHESL